MISNPEATKSRRVGGKVAATRTIHLKDELFFVPGSADDDNAATAPKSAHVLTLDPESHAGLLTIDPEATKATLFLDMNAAQASARVALVFVDGRNVVTVIDADSNTYTLMGPLPTLFWGSPVRKVVPIVFRGLPPLKPGMHIVARVDHTDDERTRKAAAAIFEVHDDVLATLSARDYATMSRSTLDDRSEPAKLALAAPWNHEMNVAADWEYPSTLCGVVQDPAARSLVAAFIAAQHSAWGSYAMAGAADRDSKDVTRSAKERARSRDSSKTLSAWGNKDSHDVAKLAVRVKALRKKYRGDCLR
jgi:hypothetical protein